MHKDQFSNTHLETHGLYCISKVGHKFLVNKFVPFLFVYHKHV